MSYVNKHVYALVAHAYQNANYLLEEQTGGKETNKPYKGQIQFENVQHS